jgi:hypothetical protein
VSKLTNPNDETAAVEEFHQLIDRAQRGDNSTLPAIRRLLANPTFVDEFGDLARQAELSLVKATAGDNLAFREGLLRKLELLRQELLGDKSTPLERLLVERIVACWLQVQEADARYAQAQDRSFECGTYNQRRMDRAHKRYLSAIKTLATVRKLAVPVLQVNIGRKQVNVANLAGTCPAVDENA